MTNLLNNFAYRTLMTILAVSTYGAGVFCTIAIPYSIWLGFTYTL